MKKHHINPNGTRRIEVNGIKNFVLDGNVIRTYTRSKITRELSPPSVRIFSTSRQAEEEFNSI